MFPFLSLPACDPFLSVHPTLDVSKASRRLVPTESRHASNVKEDLDVRDRTILPSRRVFPCHSRRIKRSRILWISKRFDPKGRFSKGSHERSNRRCVSLPSIDSSSIDLVFIPNPFRISSSRKKKKKGKGSETCRCERMPTIEDLSPPPKKKITMWMEIVTHERKWGLDRSHPTPE